MDDTKQLTSKIYKSRIPGQRFICVDGTEINFSARSANGTGVVEVSNPEHIAELDAIIGRQSQIFVELAQVPTDPVVEVQINTKSDVMKMEGAITNSANAVVKQEINDGSIDQVLAASMAAATQAADAALAQSVQTAQSQAAERLAAIRAAQAAKNAA